MIQNPLFTKLMELAEKPKTWSITEIDEIETLCTQLLPYAKIVWTLPEYEHHRFWMWYNSWEYWKNKALES